MKVSVLSSNLFIPLTCNNTEILSALLATTTFYTMRLPLDEFVIVYGLINSNNI
jgi:hypothetical protein